MYGGDPKQYGTSRDFLIGRRPGGIHVFGVGLALYAVDGRVIGTACAIPNPSELSFTDQPSQARANPIPPHTVPPCLDGEK